MGATALTSLAMLAAGMLSGALLGRRRRRRAMNEALHELRRPLAALAIRADGPGAGEWLAQLRGALTDLDRLVNGGAGKRSRGATTAGVIGDAARRWAGVGGVEICPIAPGADRTIDADPVRLGAALDNLIANGLEHGRGAVRVRADHGQAGVRMRVENRSDGPTARELGSRSDPRRGHGLRIAARIAADAGGRLHPPSEAPGVVEARLELPGSAPR